MPALRALREHVAGAAVTLACPGWLHELVEHWRLADGAVAVDPLEPLPSSLAGVDLAVNLHGKGPASTHLLLDTHPARLVAFRHRDIPETAGSPEWRRGEREVERWCRLLTESRIPADPSRLRLARPQEPAEGRAASTVLHPGASAPARKWPAERWVRIARAEACDGRRVVLTGTADERPECMDIASAADVPEANVLAGVTSLVELAAVVAHAGLVVSGDTGVAHLATAFGTPSVVLFGPVSPAEWGPPRNGPLHRPLWAGTRGDPHADRPDPGLLRLSPERVLAEIEALRATVRPEG